MTELHDAIICGTRAALEGASVLNAQLGVGSIVMLDLAVVRPPVSGESYVRIECAWRLEIATEVLAASEDDRKILATHVRSLQSRSILDVEVLTPSLEMRLVFDDGKRLVAFPLHANSTDYENWTVHTPDRKAIIAGPGRDARIVNVDEP